VKNEDRQVAAMRQFNFAFPLLKNSNQRLENHLPLRLTPRPMCPSHGGQREMAQEIKSGFGLRSASGNSGAQAERRLERSRSATPPPSRRRKAAADAANTNSKARHENAARIF